MVLLWYFRLIARVTPQVAWGEANSPFLVGGTDCVAKVSHVTVVRLV